MRDYSILAHRSDNALKLEGWTFRRVAWLVYVNSYVVPGGDSETRSYGISNVTNGPWVMTV